MGESGTNWNHDVLARPITLLWGQTIERTHVSIRDKLADYDLQLDTSKMNIQSYRGEQEVMGGIVTIFARKPTQDLTDEVKQEGWVKILHAKLPKDNICKQDMEAFPKAKTVLEWIANFKQVREIGRQRVQEAHRYGAFLPDSTTENSYKKQSKRDRNPQGDEEFCSNTNRQ
jgi:hypothetical protein